MLSPEKLLILLCLSLLFVQGFAQQWAATKPASSRLLAVTLNQSLVITTQQRTKNRDLFCKGSREDILKSTNLDEVSPYIKTILNYFSADYENKKLPKYLTAPLVMTIIPFIVGLLVSIFIWPFLICCCCCPRSCPAQPCRQPEEQPYTKCQLNYPAILSAFFCIGLIVIAAIGLAQNQKLSTGYENTRCGIATLLDDILNGNISQTKTGYFLGTVTAETYIEYLKANFSSILSTLKNNVQSDASNIASTCSSTMTNLQTLGDGTNSNQSFSLIYTQPTVASSSVASSFGSALGNPTLAESFNGQIYVKVGVIKMIAQTIKGAITYLDSVSSTITSTMDSLVNIVGNVNRKISSIDDQTGNILGTVGKFVEILRIVLICIFSLVLVMGLLGLIGVGFLLFFKTIRCRYLVLLVCVIFTVLSILAFVVAIALVVASPTYGGACSILNNALANQTNFLSFANQIDFVPQLSPGIASCLPLGDGNIIAAIGGQYGDMFTDVLGSISDSMVSLQNFADDNTVPASIPQSTNQDTFFQEYIKADINDIIYDSTTLDYFLSVANRSRFSSACGSDSNYLADSLVPSTNDKSTAKIPCASGTSVVTTCSNFSSTSTCPNGCINLYDAMSVSTFKADVASRYPGACGVLVASQLGTVYDNWHSKRIDGSTGITSVYSRWNSTVKSNLANVQNAIPSFKNHALTTISQFSATVQSIVDPTYGISAGLNCLVVGQDIRIIKKYACVDVFNPLYELLIIVGILAFFLLFGVCCLSCSAIRFYKQSLIAKNPIESDSPILPQMTDKYEKAQVIVLGQANNNPVTPEPLSGGIINQRMVSPTLGIHYNNRTEGSQNRLLV